MRGTVAPAPTVATDRSYTRGVASEFRTKAGKKILLPFGTRASAASAAPGALPRYSGSNVTAAATWTTCPAAAEPPPEAASASVHAEPSGAPAGGVTRTWNDRDTPPASGPRSGRPSPSVSAEGLTVPSSHAPSLSASTATIEPGSPPVSSASSTRKPAQPASGVRSECPRRWSR
jgi:hypothetical protein